MNVRNMKLFQDKLLQAKVKKIFVSGKGKNSGLIYKIAIYIVLFGIGFVYLYPILYMLVNSLMGMEDLVNPTIEWVPTSLSFENYMKAFLVLDYVKSLFTTIGYVIIPTLAQTMCAALAGYAFGRFEFPLKRMWEFLVIVTFLIPTQVMLVPKFLLFNDYNLIGNPLAIWLPAALGQGIKSAVFILIFQTYFKTYPKSLDEAAEIDGASKIKVFFRVALPMAVPTIVVSILFSLVWYWNETTQLTTYLSTSIPTLPIKLTGFVAEYEKLYPPAPGIEGDRINESIRMAGTVLTILPLVAIYLALQKQFVEGIESSGITGE